ncbi:MAG: hypothetical protein BroJett014_32040 [Planctomycetota bacterium]|nr:MAG: hypothetical protein BroJett014_32040 [Planctomycetota bacterium]
MQFGQGLKGPLRGCDDSGGSNATSPDGALEEAYANMCGCTAIQPVKTQCPTMCGLTFKPYSEQHRVGGQRLFLDKSADRVDRLPLIMHCHQISIDFGVVETLDIARVNIGWLKRPEMAVGKGNSQGRLVDPSQRAAAGCRHVRQNNPKKPECLG